MKKAMLFPALGVALWMTGSAFGHDLLPPEWRGQPGSTVQTWGFGTDASPVAPDTMNNPYGIPSATITVGDFGTGWHNQLDGLGSQTGIWDLGAAPGQILLDIPNSANALPYKDVWVQVTYFQDLNAAPIVSVPGASFVSGQTVLVEQVTTGGAWMLDQSLWRIEPNPNQEQVLLASDPMFGSVVDQVVVDTICAPEPASAALLALVGGMVVSRRRKLK